MNQLEPCPHCHRHIRISEAACPFCSHSLADAFANVAPRMQPRARLGRAAAFAFGLAITPAACGDNDDPPVDPPIDAAIDAAVDAAIDADTPDAGDGDGGVPIYAAAPTPNPPKDGSTTTRG